MKIEKDVPIPKPGIKGPRTEAARLLAVMEPNDSVMTDKESTAQSMYRCGLVRGWKMATRKISGEGWRVWRLA